MNNFFFWIGVGVAAIAPLALLIIAAAWIFSYCKAVVYHAERVYHKSRLRKRMTAKEGFYVSLWLINYNEGHGFGRGKFTAMDWNNYFSKRLKGGSEHGED